MSEDALTHLRKKRNVEMQDKHMRAFLSRLSLAASKKLIIITF